MTFYIHTLGCKVNQYETQAIREQLTAAGFMECLSKDIADLYIVNTCTVTEKADSQSRHLIGLCHKTNPKAKIVVTGCYVERDSDHISLLPGVAHIVKNSDKSHIADILNDEPVRPVDGQNAKRNTQYKIQKIPVQRGMSISSVSQTLYRNAQRV